MSGSTSSRGPRPRRRPPAGRRPHRSTLGALGALVVLLTAAPLAGCGRTAPPPPAPTGVTADAGTSTSVHVMWNSSTGEGGVRGYEIYRDGKKVQEVPGERHMADVEGLRPERTYTFTVRARDAAGNLSRESTPVTVTTRAADTDDSRPPSAPGRPRGTVEGPTAVLLRWQAAKDDVGVTGYDVHQGEARIHSVSGEETEALLTGLRPGTRYRFTIRARDAADNVSPPSPALTLTTTDGEGGGGAGTAPAELTAKVASEDGAHFLELSWTPPRTGGVVSDYQIHLNGKFATTLSWRGEAPRGRVEHRFFLTREGGERYRVKLRARLPDGTWGAFSAERAVTTPEG
ncbi:fibronectin type III domain-containing protein [Streptomyces sp. OF3]|uniref:Fibronectin type III domain-containing protein n=1 Tax=Streptomyces alkaliterrae TaxID=2213162 RepID=A0A7W3WJ20_9ACTN|nr:fibronectin type III domain-containing protein [Streptomyces alkaliterrae]MBB1253261.1 fibronectin type III domain-containing protein [Streptomyces alkaliterrae]